MPGLTRRAAGMLLALSAACGLGAITTQAKLVYADGGNAMTLMLTRFVVSVLVFGLLLRARGASFSVAPMHRRALLLLGLIWSGAMICYLKAVETISVSLAVLIFYTYPLLVLAYASTIGQLRPSAALVALFVTAFGGLYLALSGAAFSLDAGGLLFAALASGGAAFTFICGARVAPKMSPLLLTFWVNAAGLMLILPLMAGQLALPAASAGMLALAGATACYLIAILSQFEALARLPAARAAFLLNLEPVVSILLAVLVLNERLNPVQASGVVLVIAAIIVSLRFRPAET